MPRISLLETAHQWLAAHLHPGDTAIDATVGNGHDYLFLSRQVGATGQVYGFDIQPQALAATAARCREAGISTAPTLIQASHAELLQHIPVRSHGKIKAVMFNLGYLPGGDKSLITQTSSTLLALQSAIRVLAPAGLLTVMAYPGHAGGAAETAAVQTWLETLSRQEFSVHRFDSNAADLAAPRLFIIQKLDLLPGQP